MFPNTILKPNSQFHFVWTIVILSILFITLFNVMVSLHCIIILYSHHDYIYIFSPYLPIQIKSLSLSPQNKHKQIKRKMNKSKTPQITKTTTTRTFPPIQYWLLLCFYINIYYMIYMLFISTYTWNVNNTHKHNVINYEP